MRLLYLYLIQIRLIHQGSLWHYVVCNFSRESNFLISVRTNIYKFNKQILLSIYVLLGWYNVVGTSICKDEMSVKYAS